MYYDLDVIAWNEAALSINERYEKGELKVGDLIRIKNAHVSTRETTPIIISNSKEVSLVTKWNDALEGKIDEIIPSEKGVEGKISEEKDKRIDQQGRKEKVEEDVIFTDEE
jgi:hypothetical protein